MTLMTKSIREIYMGNFLKNGATVTDIRIFLKRTYDIELKEYKINAQPHTRWKFNLEKEIKDIKNIVYINCYEIKGCKSKPFICGVTKTGTYGTTDFNFDKDANNKIQNYLITGRSFLNDNDFNYDKTVIYMFGCQDKQEAYLLEREIQHKFHLFGS